MIITKNWLGEFIDIKNISSEEICKTLNSIGLEVDSLKEIRIPKSIVVGKVLECDRHPNADKLSLCKVDIGKEITQIVCGAKNVSRGQFVPVATVGTVMPNGLEIKPVKLRDVDSFGMICSSEELGIAKLNDGILELDDSIGELILGQSIAEYLDDDIIEIELTANRGDCLSIYGIARELSTALSLELNEIAETPNDDSTLGIGRMLSISSESSQANMLYSVMDFKSLTRKLKIDLRLAIVELNTESDIKNLLRYITYTTGVILRYYGFENNSKIEIKNDDLGFDSVYLNGIKLSTVGINQKEERDNSRVIIEASYINPEHISKAMFEAKLNSLKIESDELFYRTSRGSEPNLKRGFNYLYNFLKSDFIHDDIVFYSGTSEISQDKTEIVLSISNKMITNIIGQTVDTQRSVGILKSLGFKVNMDLEDDNLIVNVPDFRHDIKSYQDIVEEIVRMLGIDNINSKPFIFAEKSKYNSEFYNYKNRRTLRYRAVSSGFFESVSYLFCKRENLIKYGFEVVDEAKDLLNPIVAELDTLRSSILPNLVDAVSKNMNFGKKSVKLFEIGSVFNSNREEKLKIAFVFSGFKERESFQNNSKPKVIDFFTFANKIENIVGKFELKEKNEFENRFIHPFHSADIYIDGQKAGYISKLHLDISNELDLPATFVAEIDFDAVRFDLVEAKEFSKFQALSRDLSLLVDKNISYQEIKNSIKSLEIDIIKDFVPIDIYSNQDLADKISLTIRFTIQSDIKTLEDSEIKQSLDLVLAELNKKFDIGLR